MSPSESSSAYSYKPGGSLKFKGAESSGDSRKKRKKSRSSISESSRRGESSHSAVENDIEKAGLQLERERKGDGVTPGESKVLDEEEAIDHIQANMAAHANNNMTEAEKKFNLIRKKRLADRVAKQAKLSHKDRVDAFNRDLESRTEHFEMGRVGGGG